MTAGLTRRTALIWLTATFALMAAAPRAGAESALETITAMVVYLGSAANLFSGAQARVDKIEQARFEKQDRDVVRAELVELLRALNFLLPRQQIFIGDLRDYIRGVKANNYAPSESMEAVWNDTRRDIGEIVTAAQKVFTVVTRPDSKLYIAVADADRVALQSALTERVTLLGRFQQMPPPRTEAEITQLGIMADRYDKLRRTAQRLSISLVARLRTFPD